MNRTEQEPGGVPIINIYFENCAISAGNSTAIVGNGNCNNGHSTVAVSSMAGTSADNISGDHYKEQYLSIHKQFQRLCDMFEHEVEKRREAEVKCRQLERKLKEAGKLRMK